MCGIVCVGAAGCVSMTRTDSACVYFDYIYFDESDVGVCSEYLARQVLTHNLKYQELCE